MSGVQLPGMAAGNETGTVGEGEKMSDDPFLTDLFGGSPRTVTSASETSIDATIVPENQSELETLLSDQAIKSSSDQQKGTWVSSGGSLAIDVMDKPESNAPYSGTRARTSRRSLSDRLTLSLISAGLVCGITPSLTRKQSGQPIQVLALSAPDGNVAARLERDFSSSNGSEQAHPTLVPVRTIQERTDG